MSETEVEERCVGLFRETSGMALACYSGQNIDRMVTMYRAAKRAGRTLVLDLYAASVAAATGRQTTVPQSDWEGVEVFVPLTQRIKVKKTGEFDRTTGVRGNRIYPEHLANRADRLVMTFRGSMAAELERAACLEGASAVWSMWPGYLDGPAGERLRNWFAHHGISVDVAHSSGHATVADLQALAQAIDARHVVPVHTRHPEAYDTLVGGVRRRANGEWWPV